MSDLYEAELGRIGETLNRIHSLARFKHIGLLECSEALNEWAAEQSKTYEAFVKLLDAAKEVQKGLNARIDAADAKAVPVFDGIADLHTAIHEANEVLCYKTFDCANGDHSDCCPAK